MKRCENKNPTILITHSPHQLPHKTRVYQGHIERASQELSELALDPSLRTAPAYDSLQKTLAQAIEIERTNPNAFMLRSRANALYQRYGDALSDIKVAAQLLPQSPQVALEKAQILMLMGRLPEALADYNTIVFGFDETKAYIGRGYVELQMKNYEKAIADFQVALKRKSQLDDLYGTCQYDA